MSHLFWLSDEVRPGATRGLDRGDAGVPRPLLGNAAIRHARHAGARPRRPARRGEPVCEVVQHVLAAERQDREQVAPSRPNLSIVGFRVGSEKEFGDDR